LKATKEIEEMFQDYWIKVPDLTDSYASIDAGHVEDSFKAGFQKCQEIMLAECSEGFEEWKYKCEIDNSIALLSDNQEWVAREAYQAANLSSLKEIEELKTKLAQVEARNEVYREALEVCSESGSICSKSARNALNSGKGE